MSISFDKNTRTFFLDGKNITYVFCANFFDYTEHLYFGKKIAHDDILYVNSVGAGTSMFALAPDKAVGYMNTSSEFTFFGLSDYREPTAIAENENGDILTEMLYSSHEILKEKPPVKGMPSCYGGETLVVHLEDKLKKFGADLYYTVFDDCDVIARRIVYKNLSSSVKVLKRAYSFAFRLPEQKYDMISLYGAWSGERKIDRTPIHHGVASIDSKRGTSSASLNPFLALASKNADELSGDVYGVSLVYSGSFKLACEGLTNGDTLVFGGINDFNFSWQLLPNEEFETPEVLLAFSPDGIGGMSRELHDAQRNHLINKKYVFAKRPIVINNWEATHFDFSEGKIKSFISAIKDTKIDTFVLDDGWFNKRNSENAGLGDWFEDREKLPHGLSELADFAHANGKKFGLWIEPEMINEDSEMYREHPEYAVCAPDRTPCKCRKQFVLDLTKQEVRDRIVDDINKILHKNNIDYVKWDCNRNLTEFFSESLPKERQGEFAHRYCLGLYDLCERIVNQNPEIFFEGCSSGGARFDCGMLYYFPQIWVSDNTDAFERTFIQYGTSIAYPLSSLSCHVTAVPKRNRVTPFETRADIAGLGATGYEFDPTDIPKEEFDKIDASIDEYNEFNAELVLTGDLYRLADSNSENYFIEEVVAKDKSKAIAVCFLKNNTASKELKRFCFKGLDENKKYFVKELDKVLSGSTLANVGIPLSFGEGDYLTKKYHVSEVK